MATVVLRNGIRDTKEKYYKELLKGYGFKYDKEICLITKDFAKGCMCVSFDYDRGTLIGWSILIWDKSYKEVYRDIFLVAEDLNKEAFDNAYNKAKAFMKKM